MLSQYQGLVVKQLVVQGHGLEKNSSLGEEDSAGVPDDVESLQKELVLKKLFLQPALSRTL